MKRSVRYGLFFGCAAVAVSATLAAVAGAGTQGAGASTFTLTSDQVTVATQAARVEANLATPNSTGNGPVDPATSAAMPTTSWASNVQSVSWEGMSRVEAQNVLDTVDDTTDTTPVVLIHEVGNFAVSISAPPGEPDYATGTHMFFTVDASTGEVLDFSLANTALLMPASPTVVYTAP